MAEPTFDHERLDVYRLSIQGGSERHTVTLRGTQLDSENPVEARNKGEMNTFGALNAFVGSQMSILINEKRELSKFELSEPLATHLEKNQMTLELAGPLDTRLQLMACDVE